MKKFLGDSKAFTLVEVLLVTVIFLIIAGIAIPNFSKNYLQSQLKETVNHLAQLMRYAQSRAITQAAKHRLQFNEDRTQYWITKEDSENAEEFQRVQDRFGRTFNIASQVTVESSKSPINFYTNGSIEKTRIYICQEQRCYTISTQDQSGYIQIFDEKIE